METKVYRICDINGMYIESYDAYGASYTTFGEQAKTWRSYSGAKFACETLNKLYGYPKCRVVSPKFSDVYYCCQY